MKNNIRGGTNKLFTATDTLENFKSDNIVNNFTTI